MTIYYQIKEMLLTILLTILMCFVVIVLIVGAIIWIPLLVLAGYLAQ